MLDRCRVIQVTDGAARLGLVPGPLALQRAWPRGDDHMLLEFADAQGSSIAGQWFSDPAQLQIVASETARGCPRVVTICNTNDNLLLQAGGADRRLHALAQLAAEPGAQLLAHRPERRGVVRLEQHGTVRFTKVLRRSRTDRLATLIRHVADYFEGQHHIRVPTLIDATARAGTVTVSELTGTPLFDRLADPRQLVDGARKAGAALRHLHSMPTDGLNNHDAASEARILHDRLQHVRRWRPGLHEDLLSRLEPIAAALQCTPSPTVAIHRDFYDKQLILDSGEPIGLIDFDTLATGEAALDVANMLVHLELRVLQQRCNAAAATEASSAFLDSYGDLNEQRLSAYADAARLRLACLYAFRPHWFEQGLPQAIVRPAREIVMPPVPPTIQLNPN